MSAGYPMNPVLFDCQYTISHMRRIRRNKNYQFLLDEAAGKVHCLFLALRRADLVLPGYGKIWGMSAHKLKIWILFGRKRNRKCLFSILVVPIRLGNPVCPDLAKMRNKYIDGLTQKLIFTSRCSLMLRGKYIDYFGLSDSLVDYGMDSMLFEQCLA